MGNQVGPVVDKSTTYGETAILHYACCEMQGWRETMEDASLCQEVKLCDKSVNVFGVFDGHGGPLISKFVASNFIDLLKKTYEEDKENNEQLNNAIVKSFLSLDEMLQQNEVNEFLKEINNKIKSHQESFDFKFTNMASGSSLSDLKHPSISSMDSSNLSKKSTENANSSTISSSVESIEDKTISETKKKYAELFKKRDLIARNMGTTANIVILDNNYFYVANAGDSLAVVYKNRTAIRLNTEHKPSIPSEEERIAKAGLKIFNNRIEGKLNLSRAIGDLCFKNNSKLKPYEQAVTCYPEINKYKITDDMEFIVMGCDGIWDCVDIQKFCNHISLELKIGLKSPSEIISSLMDNLISRTKECKSNLKTPSLAPIGTDNMTCTLLVFKNERK